jgi:osmotically-inducible protein OsmY
MTHKRQREEHREENDVPHNTGESRSSDNRDQPYRREEDMQQRGYPSRYHDDNGPSSGYNDLDNEAYEQQTGKYENYDGGGYYGSNYGSINASNQGRDYEQNAGYREAYNRLSYDDAPGRDDLRRRREEYEHRSVPAGVTHRGKGPRSYQRSDERIREDIEDILMEDPYVDASDIEVEVRSGEVILKGIVDNKLTKRRVENLVESVAGVKQTENRLRSRTPGGHIVNIDAHGE